MQYLSTVGRSSSGSGLIRREPDSTQPSVRRPWQILAWHRSRWPTTPARRHCRPRLAGPK